jgi:transposase
MGRPQKLTEEQIQDILRSDKSLRDLAKDYNVTAPTISRMKTKYGEALKPPQKYPDQL